MAELTAAQHAMLHADYWFSNLPDALGQWLITHGVLRHLHDAQPLFFRGDAPDGLYAVLKGTLRVSGVTDEGREALLSLVDAPMWLGEIALFDRLPRTHDVAALGDTTVLFVRMADLDVLLQQEPGYWQHFGVLMAFKTRLVFINLEDMALLPPEGRLARRLFLMAQSSVQVQTDGKVRLTVSQANLALMLSMSRQTANRTLMALQNSGVVSVAYGVIEVLNPDALADIARLSTVERRMMNELLNRREPRIQSGS